MELITDFNKIISGLKTQHSVTTRYYSLSTPRKLDVSLDFTLCELRQILGWASADRVIRLQKQLRSLPNEAAFDAFHELGSEVEILALQAHLPLEQHTTLEDLIKNLRKNG